MIINSSEIRIQNNHLEPREKPYLLLIERFFDFKGVERINDVYGYLNVVPISINVCDRRKFNDWNDIAGMGFATALPMIININRTEEEL